MATYSPGDLVDVTFTVTDPRGRMLPEYFRVEQSDGGVWTSYADDGDWATTIEWERRRHDWLARATWRIPEQAAGTYRLVYLDGSATTTTPPFSVAV